MHLNDSIGHQPGIEVVYNLHEQASAVAAEAYARVNGDLGVALVTSGPGSTNAVTGVLAAWLDSTPVLFLSGQAKRADLKRASGLRQLGSQEVDICSIVRPITKYAVTVEDPERILEHLDVAFNLAHSGRPGPVWLDIPVDVQAAPVDPDRLVGAGDRWHALDPIADAVADEHALDHAAQSVADMLARAERPVLLVGNGVRVARAVESFQILAHRIGIPVLTTRLGIDLIAGNDPLCFGIPGTIASRSANFTLQNSDFLLAIGTRLDQGLIAYNPAGLARDARKVMVNIDGAELARLAPFMDLTVQADAGAFIEALARHLADDSAKRDAWLNRCRAWRVRYPFVTSESTAIADKAAAVSVYRFAEILAGELDAGDVILPGSSGAAVEIFLTAFRSKEHQRIFHNKGTGAMGFGLPAAVGASIAANGRPVVCIDGDGGIQFNIQELETIRRLQLPIKVFVVNNGGYASIRQSQSNHFGRLTGADGSSSLTLPDVGKVAKAYGIAAMRIAKPRSLRRQIRRVLALAGPVLCEVVVAPDEERMPRVQSEVRPDGSVVSKPLEDMWPYLDRHEFESNMQASVRTT